jgi:hypothetical protein
VEGKTGSTHRSRSYKANKGDLSKVILVEILSSIFRLGLPVPQSSANSSRTVKSPGINSHLKEEIEFFKTFDFTAKAAYLNYKGRCERYGVASISIQEWKLDYDRFAAII